MVGTTRFELATSPTPILETTQSEQLSETHQYVRERKTIQRNAYWTHRWTHAGVRDTNAARTATSDESAGTPTTIVGISPRDALWLELLATKIR